MRKSMKNKKLLAVLAISCLSLSAVAALGANPTKAQADAVFARPSGATVAAATDFYMHDGASVRVDTSGIRFATYVTPAYHASLEAQGTVQYFATAKAVDGTEQAKEIPFRTTLNEDGNYTLYTYINFKNAETTMANQIAALYAQDFTTSTFAKVTPAEGEPIYYQASEGTGIVRSMRAVGNEAYLKWTAESTYTQADVEKYFTVGNRSTEITAYKLDTGKVAFQMPAYTGTATSVTAYVGAKQYTANYDANSDSFLIASCADTEENLSVFADDGKVYSTKIGEGIEINNTTVDTLQTAESGNYVLTEDIDMTGKTWAPTVQFKGAIDGIGHKIKNFTSSNVGVSAVISGGTRNMYPGLLCYTGAGATIKNLDVHMVTNSQRGGLIGQVWGATTVKNVNVVCDTLSTAAYGGAIANVVQGALTVQDSKIAVLATTGNNTNSGIIAGGEAGTGNVIVSNVACYNPTLLATTLYNSANVGVIEGTAPIYTSMGALLAADEAFGVFLERIGSLTFVNNQNIDVLQTATSGYYILTENIDMSVKTWGDQRTAGSYSNYWFKGTFDGNGHTISDFTVATASHSGAFLWSIDGATVKNVIFKNVNVNTANAAVVTNRAKNSTIENVVIEASISNASGTSAFIGPCDGNMILKNVAIYLKGVVSNMVNTSSVLANTYFIGGVTKISGLYVINNTGLELTPSKNSSVTFTELDGTTAATPSTYTSLDEFRAVLDALDATFKSMVTSCYNITSQS